MYSTLSLMLSSTLLRPSLPLAPNVLPLHRDTVHKSTEFMFANAWNNFPNVYLIRNSINFHFDAKALERTGANE